MVEEHNVIDQAGLTPEGHAGLIMYEARDWSEPARQIADLQRKVQTYFSFIVDGYMAESMPHLVGKPIWIRLVCQVLPPKAVHPALAHIHSLLASHNIAFQLSHFEPSDPSSSIGNLIEIEPN